MGKMLYSCKDLQEFWAPLGNRSDLQDKVRAFKTASQNMKTRLLPEVVLL